MHSPRLFFYSSTLIVFSLAFSGCIAARNTPNLERLFASARSKTGKRPVIVIPGILGSELVNSKTGERVWPSAFRSKEDGLPMSPNLDANRDDLVPGKIIETVKLSRIVPEVYVYRDLLDAMRHYAGYHDGDWENPGVDGDKDTFYVFAYDWRQDNVTNARELIRRIERLKGKLQRPELRFNIVAHSMGGLIARYAAMYGNADLPPGDEEIRPSWAGAAHIDKIVMIGVPNEGSADAFATLIAGYSVTEGLRRRVPLLNKLTAEDAISSPALFQLLPHGSGVRFLDENLQPLQVDLYDAEVWKRYGWGPISDRQFRRKYSGAYGASQSAHAEDGKLESLDAYFVAVLKRARRFHQALDAVSLVDPPVTMLAIGGDCEETFNSPVVLRDPKQDRWITLIRPRKYRSLSGASISERQVAEAMYVPGDGRVTRASLIGEHLARSVRDIGASGFSFTIKYVVFGCDLHGQLQRNKTLQDNALTAILSETMK